MLRQLLLAIASLLAASAAVSAHEPEAPTCSLKLELIERNTSEPLPGMVRVGSRDGQPLRPPELVNRGQGIDKGPITEWSVLTRTTTITVPAAPLVIQALSGLETDLAAREIDLTGQRHAELQIPLDRFAHARRDGYVAGNTHLHLKHLSHAQADRYLSEVPLADGLDVVFLSYLERAGDDLQYTSNKYTPQELARLSREHVHFGHGEEHRHNFGAHGEGYGHILLLDIPYLVQPVSIGPGIMHSGIDAPALQPGIDTAIHAGGKVVWAHNLYGFEDIPNWITGHVHANNIFDGGSRGSFKDTFYRYLNIGLRVPFSTGTDWFIYDFSRVYVPTDRPLTPTAWLDLLAEGKSYITNGPLLEFSVDGKPVGSVLEINEPRAVRVRAKAISRTDFKRLEVVQNGRVAHDSDSRAEGGHFVANIIWSCVIEEPAWLALRTVPPPVNDDPHLREPVLKNEFGHELFAHTSPVYVRIAGRDVFDRQTAQGLLDEMRSDVKQIEAQAKFENESQRQSVLEIYKQALRKLGERLAGHPGAG